MQRTSGSASFLNAAQNQNENVAIRDKTAKLTVSKKRNSKVSSTNEIPNKSKMAPTQSRVTTKKKTFIDAPKVTVGLKQIANVETANVVVKDNVSGAEDNNFFMKKKKGLEQSNQNTRTTSVGKSKANNSKKNNKAKLGKFGLEDDTEIVFGDVG